MGVGCVKTTARDSRRQAIMDIAREIFLGGGYASTSMSAIAARLGGSKGTLYNYFTSKEALFAAVIRDHCETNQAATFDGLQPGRGDVASVLQGLGERYVELVLSDASITINRVVIAEAVRFPELGRTLYEAGPQRGAARLAAYLQSEMDAGRLRKGDAKAAADQLAELSLAGLYRRRLLNISPQPSAEDIRTSVARALETFLVVYGVGACDGGALQPASKAHARSL